MRVQIGQEAAEFVAARGGRLWVWAAHPRLCCAGTPAYMHAATGAPPGLSGFTRIPVADMELWFRAPAGPHPDVLEIGLRGKRRPRVEAYWDGCLFALGALPESARPARLISLRQTSVAEANRLRAQAPPRTVPA